MGDRYKGVCAVMVGSLLGLLAVIGVSTPAAAGDVTACGDFRGSPDTRFDVKNNIPPPGGALLNPCLQFPANSVVYLNGFQVNGPGQDFLPAAVGITLDRDGFLWGPGIVKQFAVCLTGGNNFLAGPNHVAVEHVLFNQCGIGIVLGESYKVREVRIHDCTPSSFLGIGMVLGQGGFVESSIIRACDYGVITHENNKIWNLVVTRALFTGLSLGNPFLTGLGTPSGAGNAVSRTVISHPRSIATVGLDYRRCTFPTAFGQFFAGCQDGSNSVSGHTPGLNILVGVAGGAVGCAAGTSCVITQPTENPLLGATNCGGAPIPKEPLGGGYIQLGPGPLFENAC